MPSKARLSLSSYTQTVTFSFVSPKTALPTSLLSFGFTIPREFPESKAAMLLRPCALIFAAILFAAPLTAQTAPQERLIQADASHVIGPHSKTPLRTVGAGRANEGLRADWQQQLSTVQQEIGFKYLRFHGLLHDDMGVYTEDAKGNPSYNFQYIDPLYDALLAHHIRPFV